MNPGYSTALYYTQGSKHSTRLESVPPQQYLHCNPTHSHPISNPILSAGKAFLHVTYNKVGGRVSN